MTHKPCLFRESTSATRTMPGTNIGETLGAALVGLVVSSMWVSLTSPHMPEVFLT